jgi:starch synthase (maltosyl-transferring)
MTDTTTPDGGRRRCVIEGVWPEVDCGRYPAKRILGDDVVVEADVFGDGHEDVAAVLQYRKAPNAPATPGAPSPTPPAAPSREGRDEAGPSPESPGAQWQEVPMAPLGNDRWRASFRADALGLWEFAIVGWMDPWQTWSEDMAKWLAAGRDVPLHLAIGADLLDDAAGRANTAARKADARFLRELAAFLRDESADPAERAARAMTEAVREHMHANADRSHAARYPVPNSSSNSNSMAGLRVWVDRERAAFSAWYELFPRSTGEDGKHGTFETAQAVLPYIAEMGFDVVYLPPVHPVGKTHRKGRNNVAAALRDDVGSPWAIGSAKGGHKAVNPRLGTLKDFRAFVAAAKTHGLEVALDIAFQASPDHPWAKEHPEWFRKRPDGTIAHAENPPKKYQDIYPLDFETAAWESLWRELKSVFEFWLEQGVRIFRVDNPHTKAFPFWEWCIGELRAEHPDLIFLAEAFTRPKVMYRLAKLGFTQSYTYFAWRNARWELEQYLEELTQGPPRDFFRPSFWPNTPDILTEALQTGGRPAFMARFVLAATLSSSYGIYGPAFELLESQPREPGSEEYLDSEKYQLRDWDLERPDSLRDFIARVNEIRREHPAFRRNGSLRFHETRNEHLIAYSKRSDDDYDTILVVVNLDPHHTHAGEIEIPLPEWGIPDDESFQVHDLLGEARYVWRGRRHYVELNPYALPAHIFRVERRVRSEKDFAYYR